MKTLPKHIEKEVGKLEPEYRAAWDAHAAPHTLPEHADLHLRPDNGILLRAHFQGDEGGMTTISVSVKLATALRVIDEMATLQDLTPLPVEEFYEHASYEQINLILAENGSFALLESRTLAPGLPGGPQVLISQDEMGDLIDHLEAILPRLREMAGGDIPADLHALPAKRDELAWHLDQAGETMQNLAEALRS